MRTMMKAQIRTEQHGKETRFVVIDPREGKSIQAFTQAQAGEALATAQAIDAELAAASAPVAAPTRAQRDRS